MDTSFLYIQTKRKDRIEVGPITLFSERKQGRCSCSCGMTAGGCKQLLHATDWSWRGLRSPPLPRHPAPASH